jgi:hypothetical protein
MPGLLVPGLAGRGGEFFEQGAVGNQNAFGEHRVPGCGLTRPCAESSEAGGSPRRGDLQSPFGWLEEVEFMRIPENIHEFVSRLAILVRRLQTAAP